jgi:hypothetical protein
MAQPLSKDKVRKAGGDAKQHPRGRQGIFTGFGFHRGYRAYQLYVPGEQRTYFVPYEQATFVESYFPYRSPSSQRWPYMSLPDADEATVEVSPTERAQPVDREPYMAPGLVTPEKVARGKLPTDVWWHTIVSPTGKEKTGYPTQKPEGILRRIIQASSREGDVVLDFFAGSGTTGAVAAALGRKFILIDQNPESIEVISKRLEAAGVEFELVR